MDFEPMLDYETGELSAILEAARELRQKPEAVTKEVLGGREGAG